MGIIKTWFASSSPVVKMLMAISITSVLVLGNKMYLAPYLRKQRMLRAEEWAYTIIEQEENTKDASN